MSDDVPSPITDDSDIAKWWRRKYPDLSYCGRCGYPWPVVVPHHTTYAHKDTPEGIQVIGCFPLCENCWKKLGTYEARIPYYVAMWEWWATNQRGVDSDTKIDIAMAVKMQSFAEETGIKVDPLD